MDTIKACINVDHIGENLGDRPWWTQTGTPFSQAIFGVGIVEPCVNVGHNAEDRWRPPLLDADWHAFCQAIYRGIDGSEWEERRGELYDYHKEMRGQREWRRQMKVKKREPSGK